MFTMSSNFACPSPSQGLAITSSINAVLVALSVRLALAKNQPAALWAFKTALIGGLAFDEVNHKHWGVHVFFLILYIYILIMH